MCQWRVGSSCSVPCQHCSQTTDLTWEIKPRSCADTSRANPEHTHMHTQLIQPASPKHSTAHKKSNIFLLHHQNKTHRTPLSDLFEAVFFLLPQSQMSQIIALLILITCELFEAGFVQETAPFKLKDGFTYLADEAWRDCNNTTCSESEISGKRWRVRLLL